MSNILKLLFFGLLTTTSACSSSSVKHFTVFCTNRDVGISNSSLSLNFKSDSSFFKRQVTGEIKVEHWDSIMDIFHKYREKKPSGLASYVYPRFNLCNRTQVMFYEDNFPVCFMCLDERENLISVNYNVHEVESSTIVILKSLLQIDCSFAEYDVDWNLSAEYNVKDVFVK